MDRSTSSADIPPTVGSRLPSSAGRQAVWYSLALGCSTVATGVIYLLAARKLTPSEFGAVAAWLALATFVASLVDFGTNSAWVRDLSRGAFSAADVGPRMGGKLLAALAVSATSFAGVAQIGVLGAFSGLYATLLIISQMSSVPSRAAQNPRAILFANVVDRALALAILTIVTSQGGDAAIALPMALCGGSAAGAGVLVSQSPDRLQYIRALRRPVMPWTGALFFGLASLVTSAQVLDQPLTLLVAGPKGAGDLGAVAKWTMPIALLGTAMSNAMGPISGSSAGLKEAVRKSRSLLPLLVLGVGSGVVMCLLAPFLVDSLLGPAYAGSVAIFRILSIAAAICAISQPVVYLLQFSGFDRAVFFVMAPSVGLQFAILGPLLASMGAVGAAWAAMIAQASILAGLSGVVVAQWARRRSRA